MTIGHTAAPYVRIVMDDGLAHEIGATAINITDGIYLHDDGLTYPVTTWFGSDGEECDREDAITCVAGNEGHWFALTLSDFVETGARA